MIPRQQEVQYSLYPSTVDGLLNILYFALWLHTVRAHSLIIVSNPFMFTKKCNWLSHTSSLAGKKGQVNRIHMLSLIFSTISFAVSVYTLLYAQTM